MRDITLPFKVIDSKGETRVIEPILFLSDDDRLEFFDCQNKESTGFVVTSTSDVIYKKECIGKVITKDSIMVFCHKGEEVKTSVPTSDPDHYIKAEIEVFKHLVQIGVIVFD